MANYFSGQQSANVGNVKTKGDALNQNMQNFGDNAGQQSNQAWSAANDAKSALLDPNATGWSGVNPLSSQAQQDLYQNPQFSAAYGDKSGLQNLNNGWQGVAQWGGQVRPQYDLSSLYQNDMSKAVDPSKLGLSSEYSSQYNMTPQDVEGLGTMAGRTVGNQFNSTEDEMRRNAAAGNMSAGGLNASLLRAQTQGAAAAGSTMADARLNANLARLGVLQNRESTRLGAEQASSGLQLQKANTQEATRLGGVAAGNNLQFGVGQAAMAGETGLENTGAQRALGLQQMAQQGQTANFGQNLQASNEMANRLTTKAGMDQSAGLSQEQMQQQALNQQLGLYGQQQNLALQGTTAAAQLVQPSIWQKLGAAGIQAAGAGLGAFAGA